MYKGVSIAANPPTAGKTSFMLTWCARKRPKCILLAWYLCTCVCVLVKVLYECMVGFDTCTSMKVDLPMFAEKSGRFHHCILFSAS